MTTTLQQQAGLSTPVATARPSPVAIGDTPVGPGQRVYVIAEAGVNHNGDRDIALRLVDAAVEAGADAIKFQAFRTAELVTAEAVTADYQKSATGSTSQQEMLRQLELDCGDFAALREHCRASNIEFLATPFSKRDLRMLLGVGVRAVKIASTDLNNTPLLDDVAQANLPLILSTGASHGDEIERTVNRLTELGCRDRLILLHCVSSYPTVWHDANLRRIGSLRERFGLPSGFSDHTASVETGALAAAAGACMLEKHFTLNRSLPGPDQAMSLEPDALADYIADVRRAEQALGDGRLEMQDSEMHVRRIARRSIVAANDVKTGEVLHRNCLTTKRPGNGIEPDAMEQLIGRRAAVPIPADTVLTWEMVE